MKILRAELAALFLIAAWQPLCGQSLALIPTSYHVVHGWPELPDGFTFGEVSAVAVDSHNHVWVAHHGSDKKDQEWPIMCFDGKTGKFLTGWGQGYCIHGLAVDHQDNLWLVSANHHQVYHFTHDGKLLTTIGERDVPGCDRGHFSKPTTPAVAPNGDIYLGDGYGNHRVVKISAKGEFLFDWGKEGSGPGEFKVPHSVAVDSNGLVYVADRDNRRIQIFDPNGNFLKQWYTAEWGLPWAIAISRDGRYMFSADGGETNQAKPLHAGVVKLDLNTGKLLERWGKLGQYDGQFYWAHGIAVGENGDVYVTDVHVGRRVQKFVTK